MGPLTRASVRFALVSVVALFLVAAAGAAVRLLPWLLAPGVPFGVALPFARALAARALEIAVLLGMPIGFGIATARFVDRGEARALHALGVSPRRMLWQLLPGAAALSLAYAAIGAAPYESPGRFAAALVQQGRESCAAASDQHSVDVPLVGVSWLCFPPARAFVTGRVPGISSGAWFTATTLSPSDDLSRIDLTDLRIALRARHGFGPLSVYARSATISGLPPWGRPSTLGPLPRALLVASTALLIGLAVAYVVLESAVASRLAAGVLAGAAAIVSVSLMSVLDRTGNPRLSGLYIGAPVLSMAAVWILGWILGRLGRSGPFSRFLFEGSRAALPNGPHGDRNPAAK